MGNPLGQLMDCWRLPAILELVGSCQSHVQGLGCSVGAQWSKHHLPKFGCKVQGYSQLRICSSQAGGMELMEQLLVLTGSILCGLWTLFCFWQKGLFPHIIVIIMLLTPWFSVILSLECWIVPGFILATLFPFVMLDTLNAMLCRGWLPETWVKSRKC